MKRRKLWVAPVVLMFGAVDSNGKEEKKAKQGSPCGESVIRYGEECGVRNYGHCRPRNNKDCEPVQIGSACYPGRSGTECDSKDK
ncbi:MAG: hypothetical protein ACYC9O_18980 [Candidatus Latescibacterota bacterium]